MTILSQCLKKLTNSKQTGKYKCKIKLILITQSHVIGSIPTCLHYVSVQSSQILYWVTRFVSKRHGPPVSLFNLYLLGLLLKGWNQVIWDEFDFSLCECTITVLPVSLSLSFFFLSFSLSLFSWSLPIASFLF